MRSIAQLMYVIAGCPFVEPAMRERASYLATWFFVMGGIRL